MFFIPKKFQSITSILFALYFGWKAGQKDKERDIAGEDPCLVDINGERKPMPRAVCKIITASKGLLGTREPLV